MKSTIEVSDRKEAELIRTGLADPATRAVVKIMGALIKLPTDRARTRVLNYAKDLVESGDLVSVDEATNIVATQGRIE